MLYTLLAAGVQNGDFHITADLLGSIFRSSTRGSTPHNNVFMDAIYSFLGWVSISTGQQLIVSCPLRLVLLFGDEGWMHPSLPIDENIRNTWLRKASLIQSHWTLHVVAEPLCIHIPYSNTLK
jgi:hypothetical protein